MKTKVSLFVFAIFTSISIQALEPNTNDSIKHRIDIRINTDNLVVFRADCFEGQKKLNYILKVYSEDGDMVYASSFLRKGPIFKTYSLSNLPKGEYTFKVYKKLKPIYSKKVMKGSLPNTNSSNEQLLVVEQ